MPVSTCLTLLIHMEYRSLLAQFHGTTDFRDRLDVYSPRYVCLQASVFCIQVLGILYFSSSEEFINCFDMNLIAAFAVGLLY